MDPLRQDSLAGARLALQQDDRFILCRQCGKFPDSSHSAALAEKRLLFFPEPLLSQTPPAQGPQFEAFSQKNFQLSHVDRLGEKVVRSAAHGFDGKGDIAGPGDDYNGDVGARHPQVRDPVDPVSVGQTLIQDDRIDPSGTDNFLRFRQT